MKCKEYNTFSVLCQCCEYPLSIKCCRNLTDEEEKAYSKGLEDISQETGIKLFEE